MTPPMPSAAYVSCSFSRLALRLEAFVKHINAAVDGLEPDERAAVGRGSYLVNAIMNCNNCHTDGNGDGMFDGGLIPDTFNVNTAAYLAGGVNVQLDSYPPFPAI